MNLSLTIIGAIASLIGAIISIRQASRAKSAASEAERVKNQILENRHTSELSKIQSACKKAQNAMAKYGPASSLSRLSGIDPGHDAEEVQSFLLLITEHRDYFKHNLHPHKWNEADSLCNKINPILTDFVNVTEGNLIKERGTIILLELNKFSSIIKKLMDIQISITE